MYRHLSVEILKRYYETIFSSIDDILLSKVFSRKNIGSLRFVEKFNTFLKT